MSLSESLRISPLSAQIESGIYFATLSTSLSIWSLGMGTQRERNKVIDRILIDLAELQKNYKIVKL
jgi:hypothetical protein